MIRNKLRKSSWNDEQKFITGDVICGLRTVAPHQLAAWRLYGDAAEKKRTDGATHAFSRRRTAS